MLSIDPNATAASFFKWANPGLFMFIFVHCKNKLLQQKTVGFSMIRARIVRLKGEHADHLTITTTALTATTFYVQDSIFDPSRYF